MTKIINAEDIPFFGNEQDKWFKENLIKGTWYVLQHGNALSAPEVSVCHYPGNTHGFRSYGWDDEYKIIIYESQADYEGEEADLTAKEKKYYKKKFAEALKKAELIAETFNLKKVS